MEFLKTILVVVITGWIGNKITQIFQEKSFRNQQKVKNAETEMERITVISTRLIQAASKRRFALQNLVIKILKEMILPVFEKIIEKQFRYGMGNYNY